MSTEYMCVAQRGQYYMTVHVQGQEKQLSHLTTEIKTAQCAAERIAKILQIPCQHEVQQLQKPCITMIQEGKYWVPATVDNDKIVGIEGCKVACKVYTLALAKLIAETKQWDFVSPGAESVCVVKINPIYMVAYVVGEEKILIGCESCEENANNMAQIFVKEQDLPYDDVVYQPDRPIITLVKKNGNWLVIELRKEHIGVVSKESPEWNEEGVRKLAKFIAEKNSCDMIPELGNLIGQFFTSSTA